MARMLTSEDTANIRNMLQDPDAGGDVLFWLYATVAYAVLRVTTEVLFPGKIGKFTTQQFVITLLHQVCRRVVPVSGSPRCSVSSSQVISFFSPGRRAARVRRDVGGGHARRARG